MAEQLLGIRKYLQDQGYGDSDIGFNNGNVTLKGQNLISATPQAQTDLSQGLYKDSAYASSGALKNALAGYQNTYGAPKLDNTNKMNNLNNSLYNNTTAKPFEFKQQQSPFSYDPNSDQAYQAALRSAQSNIKTGQNNTLANLLAHGQGNSSYAASAAQQIANKEMGNVSNNILPQLIQQAYQRYQDQNNNDYRNQAANYGVGQDQFKNQSALSNYFNGLGQQEIDNQYKNNALAETIKQNNWVAYKDSVGMTGDLGTGAKLDYSLLGDITGNLSLPGQQFQNNVKQQGIENTRADKQLNASLANMSSDNARAAAAEARAAGNQQLGQLFDIWDRTGQAPQGIPGVTAGTPLRDKTSASGSAKVDPKESANNYNTILGDLGADGVTREQAMQLAQANSPYLTDADYRKLLDTIQKQF